MKPIIIDTGFFIAISNKRDRFHKQAITILSSLKRREWWTTWPVLTELSHLDPPGISGVLSAVIDRGLNIIDFEEEDVLSIQKVLTKYQVDLADASLVALAEKLKTGDILSTDKKDFSYLRWFGIKKFNNKLFD